MKDKRPSRKESKAQDNIREYLQDIAMGSTTHFSSSTVGKWRRRYRDFEKSEKQARKDFNAFFDGVPPVAKSYKEALANFVKTWDEIKGINEVEAPAMEHDYVVYDEKTLEEAGVSEQAYRILEGVKKRWEKEKRELIGDTAIEKYDRSITVPHHIAQTIHYRDNLDEKITIWMIMVSVILGRAGHYLYSVM